MKITSSVHFIFRLERVNNDYTLWTVLVLLYTIIIDDYYSLWKVPVVRYYYYNNY
jgi:hypothetical protein